MNNTTQPEPGFTDCGEPRFSGIFVPRFVLEDARLSPTDRILFGLVDGMARSERGFFGSNLYLSKVLRLTPRGIQKSLARLKSLGYLWTTELEGGRRFIATRSTMENSVAYHGEGGRTPVRGGTNSSSRGGRTRVHPYIKGDRKEDNSLTPNPSPSSKRPGKKRIDYKGGF
jgi:hypothetical protein